MPVRTISATGGNWSNLLCWVEGSVPVAGDEVIGNASSGNLTVNVATAIMKSIHFADYTRTITFTNILNVAQGTGTSSIVLGPSMSFAGSFSESANLSFGGSSLTASIRTNGITIPYFRITKNTGGGNVILEDELRTTTFAVGLGNSSQRIFSTYSIFCQNYVRTNIGGGSVGGIFGTATTIFVQGPTASFTNLAPLSAVGLDDIGLEVDVVGTCSFSGPFGLGSHTIGNNQKFYWKSGVLDSNSQLYIGNPQDQLANAQTNIDFTLAGTFSKVWVNDLRNQTGQRIINLVSDLKFTELEYNGQHTLNAENATRRKIVSATGSGALRGGTITAVGRVWPNTATPVNTYQSPTYSMPMLSLNVNATHSFSKISLLGRKEGLDLRNSNQQCDGNAYIFSGTPGTRTKVEWNGGNDPSIFVYYKDIEFVNGTVSSFGGSSDNSIGIQNVSFSSGVSGGSWTFVQ